MADVQDGVEVQSEQSEETMEDSLQLSRTRLRDLLNKAKSGYASEAIKNMIDHKFRISPSIDDVLKYGDVNSLLKVKMNEKLMQDPESSSSSEQIDPVMVLAQSPYNADNHSTQSLHELSQSIDKKINELQTLDADALRLKLIQKSEKMLESIKQQSPIVHLPKQVESPKEYTLIPGKPQKELLSPIEDTKKKVARPASKSFSNSKSSNSIDISAIQQQSQLMNKTSTNTDNAKKQATIAQDTENRELKDLLTFFSIHSDNSQSQTKQNQTAAKIFKQKRQIDAQKIQQVKQQKNNSISQKIKEQNSVIQQKGKPQTSNVQNTKQKLSIEHKILVQKYRNRNINNIQGKDILGQQQVSSLKSYRASSVKPVKSIIQPPRCSSQIKQYKSESRSVSQDKQMMKFSQETIDQNNNKLFEQLNAQILSINQPDFDKSITTKRKKSFSQIFITLQNNTKQLSQDNDELRSQVLQDTDIQIVQQQNTIEQQQQQQKEMSPQLALLQSSIQLQQSQRLKKSSFEALISVYQSIIHQKTQEAIVQQQQNDMNQEMEQIADQFRLQSSQFTCLYFLVQKYNNNLNNFEAIIKRQLYQTIQQTFNVLKEGYIQTKFTEYTLLKKFFGIMKIEYKIRTFVNKIQFKKRQRIFKFIIEVFIIQLSKWQSNDVKYVSLLQKMQNLRLNNSYESVRFRQTYNLHNNDLNDVITSYKRLQRENNNIIYKSEQGNSFDDDNYKAQMVCQEIKEKLLKDVIEVDELDGDKLNVSKPEEYIPEQQEQQDNLDKDVDDILVQIYDQTNIDNSSISQYSEPQYQENSFVEVKQTPQFLSPKSQVSAHQQAEISLIDENNSNKQSIQLHIKYPEQNNAIEPKSPLSIQQLPKMASPVKKQKEIIQQPYVQQIGQLSSNQTISSSHSFKEIKFNHLKYEQLNCKSRFMSQQIQLKMQGQILQYKQVPRPPAKQKVKSVEQIMRERRHVLQAHQEIQHYLLRTSIMHWHLLTIKKQNYKELSAQAVQYYQNYLLVVSIRALREEYKRKSEQRQKIEQVRSIMSNYLKQLTFFRLKQNIKQQKLINAKTKYLQRKLQIRIKRSIFYGLMSKSYEIIVKYHKFYRKMQKEHQFQIKSYVFYCMKKESTIFKPLIQKAEEYQLTVNTIKLMSAFQAWQERTAVMQELKQVSQQIQIPHLEQIKQKSFNILVHKLNSNDQKFQKVYNNQYLFNVFYHLRIQTQDSLYMKKNKYICFYKLLELYKQRLDEQEKALQAENFHQHSQKTWLLKCMQNYTLKQIRFRNCEKKLYEIENLRIQKATFQMFKSTFQKKLQLGCIELSIKGRFHNFLQRKYFVELMTIYNLKHNIISDKGQKYLEESARHKNYKRQFENIFIQKDEEKDNEKRHRFQELLHQKLADASNQVQYIQKQDHQSNNQRNESKDIFKEELTFDHEIRDPQISEITSKLTQLRQMLQSQENLSESSLFGQRIKENVKDSFEFKSIILNSQDQNFVDKVVDPDLMLSNLVIDNKHLSLDQKLSNINNQLRSLMQTDI